MQRIHLYPHGFNAVDRGDVIGSSASWQLLFHTSGRRKAVVTHEYQFDESIHALFTGRNWPNSTINAAMYSITDS